MQFSSRLNLASHILLYLAEYQDQQKVTSKILAATTGVNAVNVRKTLCLLKAAGLIETKAGAGGTYLKRKPSDITLADIFDAVESPEKELFPMHSHPNQNCPVGRAIKDVMASREQELTRMMHQKMEQMTLQQMADDMHQLIREEDKEKTKEQTK